MPFQDPSSDCSLWFNRVSCLELGTVLREIMYTNVKGDLADVWVITFSTSVRSWFYFSKQVLSTQKLTVVFQEVLCITTTQMRNLAHFEFSKCSGTPDDLHMNHDRTKRGVGVGVQLLNRVVPCFFHASPTYWITQLKDVGLWPTCLPKTTL